MMRLISCIKALLILSVFAFYSAAHASTSDVTLRWDTVEHAQLYRLEQRSSSSNTWEVKYESSANSATLTNIADGEYVFRVIGCIINPEEPDTPLCDEVAEYSVNYPLTFPLATMPPANIELPPEPPAIASLDWPPTHDNISASIGSVAGEFRVDESGAATYKVPITLPQGIAGVTPELAFNYSSSAGKGVMGRGWNLSGLSSISRCRQTFEQDGQFVAIELSYSDRFCLDGQRLILVEGVYGEDNSEYRTEIDSATRIFAYGVSGNGPAFFTVERSDGSLAYYGNFGDHGNTTASGYLALGEDNTIISWMLGEFHDNISKTDPSDPTNKIVFNYSPPDKYGENEIAIESIAYSENTVNFSYSERSVFSSDDIPSGYLAGYLIEQKAILDDVYVSSHSSSEPIISYHMSYDRNSSSVGDIQLESIQQCNGVDSGVCLNSTQFEWLNTDLNLTETNTKLSFFVRDFLGATPIDFDGDGLMDIVYWFKVNDRYIRFAFKRGEGNGEFSNQNLPGYIDVPHDADVGIDKSPKVTVIDVNGDSHQDIIVRTYNESSDGLETSNGFRWFQLKYSQGLYESTSLNNSSYSISFVDLTGDGLVDMLYGYGSKTVRRNLGGEFGEEVVVKIPDEFDSRGVLTNSKTSAFTSNIASETKVATLPYGEWLEKILTTSTFEVSSAFSAKNNFTNSSATSTIAETLSYSINDRAVADFNSDGMADVVVHMVDIYEIDEDGCYYTKYEHYSNVYTGHHDDDGNVFIESFDRLPGSWVEFVPRADNMEQCYVRVPNKGGEIYVGDINNDGATDIVQRARNSGQWQLLLSTGVGFLSAQPIDSLDGDLEYAQFRDVNNDGAAEFLYYKKGNGWPNGRWRYIGFNNNRIVQGFVGSYEVDNTRQVGVWGNITGKDATEYLTIDFIDKNITTYTYVDDDNTDGTLSFNSRIKTIKNGLGIKTQIIYEPLTNPSVYTRGTGAEDLEFGHCRFINGVTACSPVFDVISPHYVVSQVKSDAPSFAYPDDTVSVEYQYEAMRAQAGGRGMLGFEKIRTYDSQTNVTTETIYKQEFPYIGMPEETRRYIGRYLDWHTVPRTQRLSFASNVYSDIELQNGLTHFPYLDLVTEVSYSLNDEGSATTPVSTIVTDNTYQTYGNNHANLTKIIVSTRHSNETQISLLTTTENKFEAESVENWWLNRVTNTLVTHTRSEAYTYQDLDSISRESSFVYNTTTGMLEKEIIEPEGSVYEELITLHCYDSVGNRTKTITYSNVGEVDCATRNVDTSDDSSKVFRYSGVIYDDNMRYVVSNENALFPTSMINKRNSFGQVTKSTDINGVVTLSAYDSFGRKFATSNSAGQSSSTVRRLLADASSINAPSIGENYYFVERTLIAGAPTFYAYFDIVGRKVATVKQGFGENEWVYQYSRYDKFGRVVEQSVPTKNSTATYWTKTDYDDFGRLQTTTSADNTERNFEYNGVSTTSSIETGGDYYVTQESTIVKNILGETERVTDNNGGNLRYFYDHTGNLTKVIGVDDVEIVMVFDHLGRKTSTRDPDKGTWSYTYNALGELITQTDAMNHTTTYYRDSVGRTVKREVSGGSPGVSETTKYSFSAHQLESECILTYPSGNPT